MDDKVRKYVEGLFAHTPKTKKIIELREELFLNLQEKYADLLQKGASEEEAFDIVKSSVGDVEQLIAEVSQPEAAPMMESPESRRQSGIRVAIAVALYILCPVCVIVFSTLGLPIVGVVGMFVVAAIATMILVYNNAVRPKYAKVDDSLLEEFREWKVATAEKERKKKAYSGILWSLVTVVYLVVSFITFAWHITWVIFVIGAVIEQIIRVRTE